MLSYKVISRHPVNILYKSTAGRYRPVSYPDGPITARYRFIKNASWAFCIQKISCISCRSRYDVFYALRSLIIKPTGIRSDMEILFVPVCFTVDDAIYVNLYNSVG